MLSSKYSNSSRYFTLLTAILLIAFIYLIMCVASGCNTAYSPYNSYELQAQAWLRGDVALDGNYEHLELAVYNENYYVSFPPVPSVPHVIWLLIFGTSVPFGIFQKLYACAACLLIISELIRRRSMPDMHSLLWGFGFCFASALLPITLIGGVWYEAQSLSFLLCTIAVVSMRRNHPTVCCLAYALSIGCRPLTVCIGPVLLVMYLRKHRSDYRKAILHLLPGIVIGMVIAGIYGWYNYIRFDNPLEFGHTYLPEFQRPNCEQFALRYIPEHILRALFGLPIINNNGTLEFEKSGFSMYVSSPILLCGAVWAIRDIIRHRMTYVKWTALVAGSAHLLLILMHRTLGALQFGLRYTIELIPYVLIWYLASPDRRRMRYWEATLLILGLILNIVGGCVVHI